MSRHVVVDGSNLATEGRSLPSLQQLNEAVLAYLEENPHDVITVVVDATFGHRIDPREISEFDEAIENNELVSPPAGAIGRGDAFVLQIAKKAHAIILSNDSFQEFHGEHEWLFDEGRLVGGKPVPHVGWVFVPRSPVRGMISRRATRVAKRDPKVVTRPSVSASQPMPVPKSPPPGRRGPRTEAPAASVAATEPKQTRSQAAAAKAAAAQKPAAAPPTSKGNPTNELMSFLGFVEHNPVGTSLDATFESYSSHGAYAVTADDVHIYVPMRSMAAPAPRSAREVVALGERRTLVIVSFNAARRGIDAALPGFEPAGVIATPAKAIGQKKAAPRRTKAAPAPIETAAAAPEVSVKPVKPSAVKAPAKPRKAAPANKTVEQVVVAPAPIAAAPLRKAPVKKAPAKKASAKKAEGAKAPTKKAPAKKVPTKKAEGAKAPAAKVSITPAAPANKPTAPAKKLVAQPAAAVTKATPVKKPSAPAALGKVAAPARKAAKKAAPKAKPASL